MTESYRSLLIVNDNSAERATLRRYLQGDPTYTFYEAETAAEALALSRTHQLAAILVSEQLPDADALALLAALFAEHGADAFAVLVLSATGAHTIAVAAMKLGAQDYLVTGPQLEQRLGPAVAGAIDKVRQQRQAEQQRSDLAASNQHLQQALDARQASEAQLRMLRSEAQFLSDASKALAASLDYQTTLDHIARLVIPYLGDACILDLVSEQQYIHTAVVAHSDPEGVGSTFTVYLPLAPAPERPQARE